MWCEPPAVPAVPSTLGSKASAARTGSGEEFQGGELREVMRRHGSDKVTHGFTRLYDARFGPIHDRVTSLMEVGVFMGASIRMWRDYFPNATVTGLDHFTGVMGWQKAGKTYTFANFDKFYSTEISRSFRKSNILLLLITYSQELNLVRCESV